MQLYHAHHKTARRTLQGHSLLFVPFYRRRYQTGKSGYNTACAAMKHITAPQHLHRYQIPPPRRTLYRAAQPPYYNKVYIRACPFYGSIPDSAAYHRPCQPGGISMLPTPGGLQSGTGSAVRAHRVSLAPSTRRGSPAAGTRRAARNHWRLSPQLFSGFRPIANRGQQ